MLILKNIRPVLELIPVADASCPVRVGVPKPWEWLPPQWHLRGERGQKLGYICLPNHDPSNSYFPAAHANGN